MTINYWDITRSDTTLPSTRVYFNTIDRSTSLSLIGQNAPGYGSAIAENFLHLLENFASPNPQSSPIAGQLWYDTANSVVGKGQLKIHDGGTWGPVNGTWIQDLDPLITVSVNQRAPTIGELWVETSGMQLKIFNGQTWSLVGPAAPLNSELQTGSFAEVIKDAADGITDRYIIKNYVGGDVVSIIANTSFTPLGTINGFTTLYSGINLNSVLSNNMINGVASAASALRIAGNNIPSASFVRNDQDLIFNNNLTINNNSGISIGGTTPTVRLHRLGFTTAVLDNTYESGDIIFNTMRSGFPKTVLKVDGTRQGVGICTNDVLRATVDVNGSLYVASTIESAGDVIAHANLNVTNNIQVTGVSTFTGIVTASSDIISKNIIPHSTNDWTLGDSTHRFKELWVTSLNVDSTSLFGGNAASATRLSSISNFSIAGAVRSTVSSVGTNFDGSQGNVTFNTELTAESIASLPAVSVSAGTDFVAVTNGSTLDKITKAEFLAEISAGISQAGSVQAFATDSIPPPGWLFCNGASLLKSTYSILFNMIGTIFGEPDPLHFQVPNIPNLATNVKYIIKY